jgi:hypothetical protein
MSESLGVDVTCFSGDSSAMVMGWASDQIIEIGKRVQGR